MIYDLMLLLLLFVFLLEISEQVAPRHLDRHQLHKLLCMNFSTFYGLHFFSIFAITCCQSKRSLEPLLLATKSICINEVPSTIVVHNDQTMAAATENKQTQFRRSSSSF